ncbi:MAG: phosphoglucosamine mutase [Verrucomicrobia bacterium]|nr:phosphoglucosamine mutase [Verrucomicrobiota bacterium]
MTTPHPSPAPSATVPATATPPAKRLFGTDGVRGLANVEPVTAETALKLGRAAAHVIMQVGRREGRANDRPLVVLGKDTRQSGYMLENALAAGLMSLGADVFLLGPLPTPGVAFITRTLRADVGIVLTASHNPYEDNGIKFFHYDGYKLDDDIERRIEGLVFSGEIEAIRPTAGKIGRAKRIDDALARYVEFAKTSFSRSRKLTLEGMRIAVDAANGAAYKSTPWILRELGADVLTFHNAPDGTNINRDCGSTYPDEIALLVRQTGAHFGIAHDGDADRCILCDENGEIVDGDEIMAIAATHYLKENRLAKDSLVATVMSNFGLDETVEAAGGRVIRTAVGDRYVIERMVRDDLDVGGEQSGHMIFREHTTTGDGVVTALQILRIITQTGQALGDLKKCLTKYPQAQRNLKVARKPPLTELTEVQTLVQETEKALAGRGRVLLRYSGTEPKVRLLIEGRDQAEIETQASRIADALAQAIGA